MFVQDRGAVGQRVDGRDMQRSREAKQQRGTTTKGQESLGALTLSTVTVTGYNDRESFVTFI